MIHGYTNITNFQTWSGTVSRNDSSLGGWWTISADEQWVNLELYDNVTTHTVRVWVEHWSKLFLFSQITRKTSFQIYFDGQAQYVEAPYAMGYHTDVSFYVYKNTTSIIGVSIYMDSMKWGKTFEVGASWFDNVTISQRVDKNMEAGATGYITGRLLNEALVSGGAGGGSDPLEDVQPLTWLEGIISRFLGLAGQIGGLIFGTPPEIRTFYVDMQAPTNGGYSVPEGLNEVTDKNPQFSVSAIPDAGYHFDYWTVNGTDMYTDNPLRLTINGDTTVIAVFAGGAPPAITSPAGMVTILVPAIVIGGIGGAFWKLGDGLGDHGIAGFLLGGAFGFVLCAVGGLISMWVMILAFVFGFIGFYLWYGGGG